MAERLDTQRAKYANDAVQERFGDVQNAEQEGDGVSLRQYRSVVLGAGGYLRQCGLLQLAAFWLSKRDAERAVLKDLAGWLCLSPATNAIAAGTNERSGLPDEATTNVIGALVERSPTELAVLEREADEILGWLKRITEGYYQAQKRAK